MVAADWTLQRLRKLGVKTPGGNRLQRARNLLAKINADPELLSAADDKFLRTVAEAQRTIYELYIIGRSSGGRTDAVSRIHADKLEMILSGADLPEDDKNYLARNTQFELYAAAMFAMGEVPVGHAEPDFHFRFIRGEWVGLAAKRVSSTKQLRQRVKEGIDQIKRAGVRGFVAVNVDVYVRSMKLDPDESRRGGQFNNETQALRSVLQEFTEEEAFLGLINFGHVLQWDDTGQRPVLGMHDFRQFGYVAEGDEDEAEAMAFFDAMWKGVQDKLNRSF